MTKLAKAIRAQLRMLDRLTLADQGRPEWRKAHANMRALHGEFGVKVCETEMQRQRSAIRQGE